MKSRAVFVLIFTIAGFVALQVPINRLAGSRVSFTLFDLFAPISGAFLGTWIGIASVFLMQVANLVLNGFSNIDKGSIIRLIPTLFGVWFFAKKEGKLLVLPAVAIIAFNLHPIGRTVWFYSLFWLIPFLVWPLRERFLIARSLGATMTAHAVGGAIWIWVFNLPTAVWVSLIPVVVIERAIFALGISASYILMNNILAYLSTKRLIPKSVGFDKKFLLQTLNSSANGGSPFGRKL